MELSRAAALRAAEGEIPEGPLPITDRLERIYTRQVADLPEVTRRSLLLLAAADAADASAVSLGLPEADDKAWIPAEEAGLVRRDGPGISFRHPLIRSAVYHAESFEARREAHLALAERLREEPDRRAWHLAAATPHPDESVSAALQETAERARRRGGYATAAAALERAADLTSTRENRARLLTDAADMAVFSGQLTWVEQLAARVRTATDDPSLIGRAWLATPAAPATADTCRPQFAGQLVQQPGHPVLLDLVQGRLVDARRAVVAAHRHPRPPQHVSAEDLVSQRVEPTFGISLGRPVQRMLPSTNAADTTQN